MTEPEEPQQPAPAKLALSGVTKSFPTANGPLEVLAGVDLALRDGELVSLIGPSGCGKSTLLEVVAGLVQPDAGQILVDGRPVDQAGAGPLCAYMPQKDLLFPWRRLIDNLTLGLQVAGLRRQEARQRALPLLETFGLAGFERAYPAELSGGMRQRAALLRTVLQERSLLLLDEPLGALDSLTRVEMQVWLGSIWQRHRWTMLLVTHDIREAVYLSDVVYVISPRPARILARVDVKLPRPRSVAGSPETSDLEAHLLELLHGASRPRAAFGL